MSYICLKNMSFDAVLIMQCTHGAQQCILNVGRGGGRIVSPGLEGMLNKKWNLLSNSNTWGNDVKCFTQSRTAEPSNRNKKRSYRSLQNTILVYSTSNCLTYYTQSIDRGFYKRLGDIVFDNISHSATQYLARTLNLILLCGNATPQLYTTPYDLRTH